MACPTIINKPRTGDDVYDKALFKTIEDKEMNTKKTSVWDRALDATKSAFKTVTDKMDTGDESKLEFAKRKILSVVGEGPRTEEIKRVIDEAFDSGKARTRLAISVKRVDNVFASLKRVTGAADALNSFLHMQTVKRLADSGSPESRNTDAYKEYVKQNPKATAEDYKDYVTKAHDEMLNVVVNNPQLKNAYDSLNGMVRGINKQIDAIPNNGETISKDYGRFGDAYGDAVVMMMSQKNSPEFIKNMSRYTKLSPDEILSDPKAMTQFMMFDLEQRKAGAQLHSTLAQNDISQEVSKYISDFDLFDTKLTITDALASDNAELVNVISKRVGTQEELDNLRIETGMRKEDSDISVVKAGITREMNELVRNSTDLVNNVELRKFLSDNENQFPVLNKVINELDSTYGENDKLAAEVQKLIDQDPMGVYTDGGFLDVKELINDNKALDKASVSYVDENVVTEMKDKLLSKFGDYTIIHKKTGAIIAQAGKIVDLKSDAFDLNTSSMLINPLDVFDKANVVMGMDDSSFVSMAQKGEFLVIPKAEADVLSASKKQSIQSGTVGTYLGKVVSNYSKWAIAGPHRILNHNLTGSLGNLMHTVASHPTALKNLPKMAKAAISWDKKDGAFYEEYKNEPEIIAMMEAYEIGRGSWESNELSKTENSSGWSIMDKLVAPGLKIAGYREKIARMSLGLSILERMENGKFNKTDLIGTNIDKANSITNKYEKAMFIANEQMINYNSKIPGWVSAVSKVSPMFRFTYGTSRLVLQRIVGGTKIATEQFKEGDYAGSARSIASVAFSSAIALGAGAAIWNAVMVATGFFTEEDRDDIKKNENGLFGMVSSWADSAIMVPGTGVQWLDEIAGIGRADDGGPASSGGLTPYKQAIELIPGATGQDLGQQYIARWAGRLNPIFSIPVEYAAGGTLTSYGIISDDLWDTRSGTEKLAISAGSLFGAKSQLSEAFDSKHGVYTGQRSSEANDLMLSMSNIKSMYYDSYDEQASFLSKVAGEYLQALDTEGSKAAIGDYLQYLIEQGEDEATIRTKAKNLINNNSLLSTTNTENRQMYYDSLDEAGKTRLLDQLRLQQEFLEAIGWEG